MPPAGPRAGTGRGFVRSAPGQHPFERDQSIDNGRVTLRYKVDNLTAASPAVKRQPERAQLHGQYICQLSEAEGRISLGLTLPKSTALGQSPGRYPRLPSTGSPHTWP